ncbi:trypsin inhibitor A-like [Vigna unguiculata]|uniref:trypsin inhibitor A-like n=1 Tax=Vigna unguiculata TaxID=3917 RepID=UPI001016AF32|nr:trypsin inhibitor A-like [Vigna unguiculata]
MASTTILALFLLSVLTFNPPSTTAQPVTDLHGNIVRNGGRFFILPPFTVAGGIRRTKTGNETTPLSVVQSLIEVDPGLPLTITSPFKSLFIPNGSPVSISFELIPNDESPLEWTAVPGLPEGTLVKVRGYPHTLPGSFSIHRVRDNTFKLLFCTLGSSLCGNVAIVEDEAKNRLLAVNQKHPYEFVLEQLPSSSAASK